MSLADAIVKKVSGLDGSQVYEAIRKDAFDTPPSDGTEKGRVCLPSYLKTSHRSRIENVFLYQSDYVISQEDAAIRLQLFDPSYGRMRSKSIDTLEWTENFDLFVWEATTQMPCLGCSDSTCHSIRRDSRTDTNKAPISTYAMCFTLG